MRYAIPAFLSLVATVAWAGVFYPEGATTLHFAFEGNPNGDRPVIRPPAFYAHDAGFGFVDSPDLIGNANGAQAPKYFRFDVNLPPGNYDVTVRLGSPLAASNTTLKAEAHRVMAYNVATPVRGNSNVTFTVNVRASGRLDEKALDLDDRLTLEFTGDTPAMMKLDLQPNTTAPTLFILGDDKAADREDIPRAGWGQMLPLFFKSGEIAVANWSYDRANTRGMDLKMISKGGPQSSFEKALRAGDYVLIALSASDDGEAPPTQARYTAAIKSILDDVRQHKATPLLATPLRRQYLDAAGKPLPASTAFPTDWVKQAAADEKVPLIDFEAASVKWVQSLDAKDALAAFTTEDATALGASEYLSAFGAFEHARLLAMGLRDSKVELAAHLYPDIPPSNIDPRQFPAALGFDYLKKP